MNTLLTDAEAAEIETRLAQAEKCTGQPGDEYDDLSPDVRALLQERLELRSRLSGAARLLATIIAHTSKTPVPEVLSDLYDARAFLARYASPTPDEPPTPKQPCPNTWQRLRRGRVAAHGQCEFSRGHDGACSFDRAPLDSPPPAQTPSEPADAPPTDSSQVVRRALEAAAAIVEDDERFDIAAWQRPFIAEAIRALGDSPPPPPKPAPAPADAADKAPPTTTTPTKKDPSNV